MLWHGILLKEPDPTGSRPRDLIGRCDSRCRQHAKPHPPKRKRKGRETEHLWLERERERDCQSSSLQRELRFRDSFLEKEREILVKRETEHL